MYSQNRNPSYRPTARRGPACGLTLRGACAVLAALLAGMLAGGLLFSSRTVPEKAASLTPLPLVPLTEAPITAEESPAADEGAEKEASAAPILLPSSVLTVSIGGEPCEMELEEYLIGVVAGEMSASSEKEALKAQAVAARTFTALHMAGKARCKSGCTVCDDPSCCQAYSSKETLASAWGSKYDEYREKIASAVRETEGLAAVYDGELISALYHASSGPSTESSEEVFAMALPYLVSVESREGDREMVTKQEFSAEELVGRINDAYPEANMSLPLDEGDLDIWGRSESGRVQLIRIGETVIPGGDLRRVLGLKSTAFEVEKEGETVTFTCLGYGHGVGMSQTGANEMALQGAGFEEILKHFYTGTELARLEYGTG